MRICDVDDANKHTTPSFIHFLMHLSRKHFHDVIINIRLIFGYFFDCVYYLSFNMLNFNSILHLLFMTLALSLGATSANCSCIIFRTL